MMLLKFAAKVILRLFEFSAKTLHPIVRHGWPVACASILVLAQLASGAVIRVDSAVQQSGDGTTWPLAFKTIEEALAEAVEQDEIWVAASEDPYVPTEPFDVHDEFEVTGFPSPWGSEDQDRLPTFRLIKDVGIYGGFLGNAQGGGETSRSQADPANNITILSGDLGGGDFAFHVLVYFQPWDDEEPADQLDMVIDGFVITGGAATGGQDVSPYNGGYNATGGGALVIYETHVFNVPPGPVFSRCVFEDNSAEFSGGAFAGLYGGCRITECRFENNSHTATTGTEITKLSRGGGAINVLGPVVALKSTFVDNTSVTGGGAIHHTGAVTGGTNGTFLVSNCKFFANEAPSGGAIDALGSVAPGVIVNSLFAGNVANVGSGGGTSTPGEIHGCTFVKNHAEGPGGGASGASRVTNNIFWDNTTTFDDYDAGEEWRAQVDMDAGEEDKHNDYNLIQDWDCGEDFCAVVMQDCECVAHNYSADPRFSDDDGPDNNSVTYEDNDYRLVTSLSPAIDAGDTGIANDDDNEYFPWDIEDVDGDSAGFEEEVTPDIELGDRVFNDVRINNGAYESPCTRETGCIGDCVTSSTFQPPGDGLIDAADNAYLLGQWGSCSGCCSDWVTSATFQPPPDGVVDSADLAVVLGAWGHCPCVEAESLMGGSGGGGESQGGEEEWDGTYVNPFEGTYLGLLLDGLQATNDPDIAAEALIELLDLLAE